METVVIKMVEKYEAFELNLDFIKNDDSYTVFMKTVKAKMYIAVLKMVEKFKIDELNLYDININELFCYSVECGATIFSVRLLKTYSLKKLGIDVSLI